MQITHLEVSMKRIALALALATAFTSAAHAAEFTQVQAEKSVINFTYQQMGVKMDGKFKKFSSQLSFDPAKVAAAKTTFDVDLASIDAGSGDADQEVVGKAWFNVKAFPSAHFTSSNVKSVGGNRYNVAGKLTIKGKTQDVIVPATFTPQGNTGVFDGNFTIRRGDVSIGEGAWSAFDIVANDIAIKFHVTANSK
jgi:polyisoprenoid-binding protein YceI